MGFININEQQVHTSSISTLPGAISSVGIRNAIATSGHGVVYATGGGYISTSLPKKVYHILGEDFESEQSNDISLCMAIANINILGEPFYKELLKQGVSLPSDIDSFIQERFRILNRDKKIDDIIE